MSAFVKVGRIEDCGPGERLVHDFEYDSVVVVNVGGTLYAVADLCSHDEGPLADGTVDPVECALICPRHGAIFDLKTGEGTFPAGSPIPTYQVKVENGDILLEDMDG